MVDVATLAILESGATITEATQSEKWYDKKLL